MSSIVQIKDSAYDGLKSLTVYGNTVQNLWVNPSGTINGVTTTANSDGSVTINGTSTGAISLNSGKIYTLKPSTRYTVSVDKALSSSNIDPSNGCFFIEQHDSSGANISDGTRYIGYGTTLSTTFTTSSELSFMYLGVFAVSGKTLSGTYRVMLNEGSEAQPWCPPGLNSVGDGGSVEVVTAGKNLFNATSKHNQAYLNIDADGAITLGNGFTWVSFDVQRVNIPKGTKITLSKSVALGGNCGPGVLLYYDSNDTSNQAEFSIYASTNEYTYTTTRDYNRIKCFINGGSVTANTPFYVQLEFGSTATDFEPYRGVTTTPIDLQGHTLNSLPDGTRDELHIDGGGNVVLEKRVARVQCTKDSFKAISTRYCEASFASNGLYRDGVSFSASSQVNDFAPVGNQDSALGKIIAGIYTLNNVCKLRIGAGNEYNSMSDQLAATKNIIGSRTIDAMYALLEPQTIDLGTIDLPKLRKKPLVNTIWANGTAEGTGFSLAPEIDCGYNRWSTYCDGFKTHGKHSYFDMGCCIAARDTGAPEKKSVTATVPYMSGFYDLSKLYGAIAFEARQLMYRFEFVEDSREELQQKKSQFLEWLSQVHDEEIADDDIPGRHFIGSLSEWEFEEGEEGQSGSLEVTFNCQPFLEADEDTTKTCNAGSNTVTVKGQPVNAYAKTSSGTATIQIGGVTQSVGTTEIRLSVQLQPGDNAVTVTGSPVTLRWRELTA